MNNQRNVMTRSILAGMVCAAASVNALAQLTVTDNFTGATNILSWQVLGSACLTAGSTSSAGGGQIPLCNPAGDNGQVGGYGDTSHPKGYLTDGVNDPTGNGALRLTNATGFDAGAVIYNSSFSSTKGIAITFTAASYAGDSGGTVKDGADGMSFFLLDASYTPSLGSTGGSLGYSCSNSNSPYNGQSGAYIGLGIDEYGNFLNGKNSSNNGDNTASGVACSATTGSTCDSNNPDYQGNRIGLRGAGNINWTQLNSLYPSLYPSSLTSDQQNTAVQNTCINGVLFNNTLNTSTAVATSVSTSVSTSLSTSVATVHGSKVTTVSTSRSSTYTTSFSSSYSTSFSSTATATAVADYAPIAGGSLALATTLAGASNLLANEATNATRNSASTISRTYNLKITSTGLLTLTYAPNNSAGVPLTAVPVLTNASIFASNGALPAYFKFGFSAGTGGSNNVHEITCFQAAPADDSDSSAGINVVQTGQVKTGTQIYLAYYHTTGWWGQLTSANLTYNPTTNGLTIASTANWDGACVLTGDTAGAATSTLTGGATAGACSATGSTSDTPEAWTWATGSRQVLTYNAGGVGFEYANLSTTQKAWMDAGDSKGTQRVNYLRGDRSNEINPTTPAGIFRARISVLGDIIDSSPTWVGGPVQPYPTSTGTSVTTWQDLLNSGTTMPENSVSYGTYQSTNSTRLNVVYAGANDGMLHGFEAGSYDSTGTTFNSSQNDGKEVIAYIPNAVLSSIHNTSNTTVDYSSPSYAHNYYVDATPANGDVFYGGAWHSWLVGGLGAGGNAIYALDVTDPTKFSESGTNPATVVKGEWDTSTSGLGNNLGQTYGTPQIRRFHSGNWGFVFGNGYQSANGVAGVFVGLLDQTSGAVTFSFLSTSTGSTSSPNGIFMTDVVDLDGDHVADYIYAGDLQGNVWRWDITSTTPATWASTAPVKIFAAGSSQPITTQVKVVSTPNPGGNARLLVDFGTGSQTESSAGFTNVGGQQALYGIWDGNMATWNGLTGVSVANRYDTYPAATNPYALATGTIVTASQLQAQTVTGTGSLTNNGVLQNYRTMSNSIVCWADLTSCASPKTNSQYGWTFAFAAPTSPALGEQVVFNPVVQNGAFIVNTFIPSSAAACTVNQATGWTIAINPATGGAFPSSFFVNSSNVNESQVQLGATGSPSVVNSNNFNNLVYQTLTNGAGSQSINFPGGLALRLNWTELR